MDGRNSKKMKNSLGKLTSIGFAIYIYNRDETPNIDSRLELGTGFRFATRVISLGRRKCGLGRRS